MVILDTFLDVSQQGATFVPCWTPWEDSGSILGAFWKVWGILLVVFWSCGRLFADTLADPLAGNFFSTSLSFCV